MLGYDRERRLIAIQCKSRKENGPLPYDPALVAKAVDEISAFPGEIAEFFLMTTAPADARLSEFAAKESREKSFAVYIWGWDNICDELGRNPKIVRQFYGWGKTQKKIIAACILIVFFAALTLTLLSNKVGENTLINERTADDLRSSITILSSIESDFDKCERAYASYSFVYSAALERACSTPIGSSLDKLRMARERFSFTMSEPALQQFSMVLAAIDAQAKLERRSEISTRLFEDEEAQSWLGFCDKNSRRSAYSIFESTRNRTLARDALYAQLEAYFVFRDFVAPEIQQMSASLAITARTALGEPSPSELVALSNELQPTLDAAASYRFKPPPGALAFSRVKYMTSRDFHATGPAEFFDEVDRVLRHRLYRDVSASVLRDHPLVLEQAIQCGIFRKDAFTTARGLSIADGFEPVRTK